MDKDSFGNNISTVRLALRTFKGLEMIAIVNKTLTFPNWSKHQSLDQLEKKNKYQREYMRKHRQKQANLVNGKRDIEVNKELEVLEEQAPKNKPNRKANVSSLEGDLELDIYRNIVAYLNTKTSKGWRIHHKR